MAVALAAGSRVLPQLRAAPQHAGPQHGPQRQGGCQQRPGGDGNAPSQTILLPSGCFFVVFFSPILLFKVCQIMDAIVR